MENNTTNFPYLFLSNSSSSSPMEIVTEDHHRPSPLLLLQPSTIGIKPKPMRKIAKSSSNPNPNPNPRNPQRGLGVAQLERIRLQNPSSISHFHSLYDYYPNGYPLVNGYGSGSGNPYLQELPSNQRADGCVSDSCQLCCKKKRSFSETLSLQECFRWDLAASIEEEMNVRLERPETRVYQFFPETDAGDLTAGAAASSSVDGDADGFLDLSLKLSV